MTFARKQSKKSHKKRLFFAELEVFGFTLVSDYLKYFRGNNYIQSWKFTRFKINVSKTTIQNLNNLFKIEKFSILTFHDRSKYFINVNFRRTVWLLQLQKKAKNTKRKPWLSSINNLKYLSFPNQSKDQTSLTRKGHYFC